jgi:hypothetical protein
MKETYNESMMELIRKKHLQGLTEDENNTLNSMLKHRSRISINSVIFFLICIIGLCVMALLSLMGVCL